MTRRQKEKAAKIRNRRIAIVCYSVMFICGASVLAVWAHSFGSML